MNPAPVFSTPQETESAFYRAFEQCDLQAMMSVWDGAKDIACIHPQGPRLTGHRQIQESWRSIFSNAQTLKFSVATEQRHQSDKLAIHVVNEFIAIDNRKSKVVMLATNTYRLSDQGWRMTLHHASPGFTSASSVEPRELH